MAKTYNKIWPTAKQKLESKRFVVSILVVNQTLTIYLDKLAHNRYRASFPGHYKESVYEAYTKQTAIYGLLSQFGMIAEEET